MQQRMQNNGTKQGCKEWEQRENNEWEECKGIAM